MGKLRICQNHLRTGHSTFRCHGPKCKDCRKQHLRLLHYENLSSAPSNHSVQTYLVHLESSNQSSISSTVSTHFTRQQSQVLLSTAFINVANKYVNTHVYTALLDSESKSNFINVNLLRKLWIKLQDTSTSNLRVNSSSSKISRPVKIKVSATFNSFTIFLIVLITDDPPSVSIRKFQLLRKIQLADSNFQRHNFIDLLIRTDTFWNILCVDQIKPSHDPLFQKLN